MTNKITTVTRGNIGDGVDWEEIEHLSPVIFILSQLLLII